MKHGMGPIVLFRWTALCAMVLVLSGCASAWSTASDNRGLADSGPSHAPRIDEGFAVTSLWGGEVWRIFLRGSDPDGDMRHLWVVTTQLGRRSETEIIPLRGPDQGEFSGYLTLPTPSWMRNWDNVRVEVRVRDRAGNLSEKAVFEALIGFPTEGSVPVQWNAAAHHHLGTLFFRFEADGSDSRPSGGFRGF